MYRYQGTDEVNNWICFGTTDNDICIGNNNADNINKYMYRIIGVTPEGELALIKETSVISPHSSGVYVQYTWNNMDSKDECGENGENCTWPKTMLFKRLNGLSNGEIVDPGGNSNIFIGSTYYDYLQDEKWFNIITEHDWKYGDTNVDIAGYNGDTLYEIENNFSDSIKAKIGLQYIHDYYYAYPGGNPKNSDNSKNAWIHFYKDGYNSTNWEWLLTRYGLENNNVAAYVSTNNGITHFSLKNYDIVRPVFYLNSDVILSEATGSLEDPYMIIN